MNTHFSTIIKALNEKERYHLAQEYKILGKWTHLSSEKQIGLNQIIEIAKFDEILSDMLEKIDLELNDELEILNQNSEESEKIRIKLRLKLDWIFR